MKYEYKVIQIFTGGIKANELNESLKKYVNDGWEIFNIIYIPSSNNYNNDFILHYCRRKIKNIKTE